MFALTSEAPLGNGAASLLAETVGDGDGFDAGFETTNFGELDGDAAGAAALAAGAVVVG